MMATDKAERIKSIIGWMRKNITLSLDGYRPGWERASKFSIGSSLPFDSRPYQIRNLCRSATLSDTSPYLIGADELTVPTYRKM